MEEKKDTTVAIAIIVSALLIAGAVLFAANNISSALTGIELSAGTAALTAGSAGGSGSSAGSSSTGGSDSGSGSGGSGDVGTGQMAGLEGRPYMGAADAPVVLVEFSDFQCPFCRSFYNDAYKQIKSEYVETGKVKFVYRHFPLNNIHPAAQKAAEASECALDQGLFWEMHNKLFDEQNALGGGTVAFSTDDIKAWAAEIGGLDVAAFNGCLDSGKKEEIVAADFQDGVDAGVRGTPTIFINGQPVVGAQPFSSFQAVIDAELS